jgi:hypothetical protein
MNVTTLDGIDGFATETLGYRGTARRGGRTFQRSVRRTLEHKHRSLGDSGSGDKVTTVSAAH